MTSKNNRAHLLCYVKLCASFQSHWWFQTGVTARKPSIRWKSASFCRVGPWNLTDDLGKQSGISSMLLQALCIISSPCVNSNWSYGPETAKLGFDLCGLELLPLTLTFCMGNTSINGDNSWKFDDDMMKGTQWKSVTDGRTDRTDRRTDRLNHSQNCLHWSQLKNQWYPLGMRISNGEVFLNHGDMNVILDT